VAPLFSTGATESLAVASGLSTAANAEISSTVFQHLAFNLVESAIKKSRKDRRADFEEIRKRPLTEYGVEAALVDAGEYHQRCAIRRGLEILAAKNQATAPSKVALESELEIARDKITTARAALEVAALTGDSRKAVENALKEATIDEARIKALLPYAR